MKVAVWTLAVFLATSAAEARTWRVDTMGTGDAPNLYAAMDSAAAFDTVLVEAGQYQLTAGALEVPNDVWVVGESGPTKTLILRDEYAAPSTVSLRGYMSGIHVRGNTVPVVYTYGAALDHCVIESSINGIVLEGDPFYWIELANCLLIGSDIAIPGYFVYCIIMADMGYRAFGSQVLLSDVLGQVHPSIDLPGGLNFSLDPEFCGLPGSGNHFLRSTSPCLPENNPYGATVLIGPLPVGCGTVRVENRTWGGVKALYR